MISIQEYFGPYADHKDVTAEIRFDATALLDVVNDLLEAAARDGCELPTNPATDSQISGSGNGGFRPRDCKVGAANSKHKDGRAVDAYDPLRQFASWCLAHLDELKQRGLYLEDPRWTPSWAHLQNVPPGSGKVVYIPSLAPALASNPPDWSTA